MFILELGADLEARLFEYLVQVAFFVHRDDVVCAADGLAAQDHIGEGAALRQAREHGFDKVAVICKSRRRSFSLRSPERRDHAPRRSTSMILGCGTRSYRVRMSFALMEYL